MLSLQLFKAWKPGSMGQLIVAFLGCWCTFTCGQAYSWPGSVLPAIRTGIAGFTMTSEEESWMVSVTFIGNILSPIPTGYIMDAIGRKNIIHWSSLLAVASWIIIHFGHSATALFISRTLIGIWAGIVYTAVPVLVGEVVSPEMRGSMGALFGVMLYLGAMYENILGMYLSYDVLSLVSLPPAIILAIVLFFLPESPYYFLMKGDRKRASESLEWLRGVCDNDELDVIEESVKEQLENKGTFIDLFRVRPYRRAFIIVEALAAIQRMSGLTMLMTYASVSIPHSWISGEESITVLEAVWVIGSICSFFIMDKYGRKLLLFVSTVGAGLAMLAVSVWFFLRDSTNVETSSLAWFPLIGLVVNGAFYSIGLVSIPTLIQGEIFPVNIKGKASALACMTMATTSTISVKIFQPLMEYAGLYSNFLVCAVFCALGVIFSRVWMVETRGKSLEEIQDILSEKKRKRKAVTA